MIPIQQMSNVIPKKILFITAGVLEETTHPTTYRHKKIIEYLSAQYQLNVLTRNKTPGFFSSPKIFIKILDKGLLYVINFFLDKSFSLFFAYKRKIISELRSNEYDTIITTVFPLSFIALISTIKSTRPDIRLILDMSDPITGNIGYKKYNPIKKKIFTNLERKNLPLVDCLVVLNDEIKQYYKTKFPGVQIKVVEMGIESKLFSKKAINQIPLPTKLNFVYAGIFYKKIREPNQLYNAVIKCQSTVHLTLYGRITKEFMPPDNDRFIYGGVITKDDLHDKYLEADVIVFIDNFEGIQVPAKTLEILAYNKPILFIYENDNSPSIKYMMGHKGVFFAKNRAVNIQNSIREIIQKSEVYYDRDVTPYYWSNILTEYEKLL